MNGFRKGMLLQGYFFHYKQLIKNFSMRLKLFVLLEDAQGVDYIALVKVKSYEEVINQERAIKIAGTWLLDRHNKKIRLYTHIIDYGFESLDLLKQTILDKRIYSDLNLSCNISDSFDFQINSEDGEIESFLRCTRFS